MSLRIVAVLLRKELSRGPRNFIVVFALVVPIILSLVVTLLFGTLFSEKPKLGVTDEGNSGFLELADDLDSVTVRQYDSDAALREAVAVGAADVGLVLPAELDDLLANGETVTVPAFIWGQSLVRNRAIAGAAIAVLIRELAGQEAPVDVVTTTLGDTEVISWEERLLPFIVMMTIVLGGTFVPATALVNEKQHRTLVALTTTPASLGEVFMATGLLGALTSFIAGILILAINRAFGPEPWLLLVLLALGCVMAACFGVILGAFLRDINSLFATIKGIGLLLYAPALVYMFPTIPQWIGRLFPTYYMIAPIIEVSQSGASWQDIALETLILVGLIGLLIGILALIVRKQQQTAFVTA